MIFPLLLACAGRVAVGDSITADVAAPADYADAAEAATRELRLYEGLATSLIARVAYLDAPFRRAQEALRAHLLLLEEPLRAARLAESIAEAETHHVFVLSADSQWREDLRFGAGDDTPWRLRLFAGGAPCTAEAVTEIKKPTPIDERIYPFHTRWSGLWRARFLTDCGRTTPLVLQVTGPHGTGELGWRSATGG